MRVSILAFTDDGVWHPGIGDPTAMGWMIFAAYFVGAGLCLRIASLHRGLARHRGMSAFWLTFAVFMAFLGINKQLDLQTWLTELVRGMARKEGWYEDRRVVQEYFIAGIAVAGFGLLTGLWWRLRSALPELWPVLLGATALSCLLAFRAASFHHVDEWLGAPLIGMRFSGLIELGSVLWITVAACVHLRRVKATSNHRDVLS